MRVARRLWTGVVMGIVLTVLAVSATAGFQAPAPAPASPTPPAPPAPADLSAFAPRSAVAALDALSRRFDQRAAMDLVVFMDQFWRNAGNAGFNQSIDRIKARLEASGFVARPAGPADGPSLWVEQSGKAPGWDYTVGTLALVADANGPDQVLLVDERHGQDRANLKGHDAGTTGETVVVLGIGGDQGLASFQDMADQLPADGQLARLLYVGVVDATGQSDLEVLRARMVED